MPNREMRLDEYMKHSCNEEYRNSRKQDSYLIRDFRKISNDDMRFQKDLCRP